METNDGNSSDVGAGGNQMAFLLLTYPCVVSCVEGSIVDAHTLLGEAAPWEKLQANASWSAVGECKWMPRAVNNLHW